MGIKKRKLIFALVLSFIVSNIIWSYDFENKDYTVDVEIHFEFKDGVFQYRNLEFEATGEIRDRFISKTQKGSYTIDECSGYTVMHVSFPEGKRDIYVFSESRHVILYDTLLKMTIIGTYRVFSESMLFPVRWVTSNTFYSEILKGKEIQYVPANLADDDLSTVWVEGLAGSGLGAKIKIGHYAPDGIRNLLICNGFFSPSKPELYYQNNRIKEFILRGYNENGQEVVNIVKTLIDTPNLQLVSSSVPAVEFEIEIRSVYKGSKYDDTALTAIYHDSLRYSTEK